jgi:hypothetical protein
VSQFCDEEQLVILNEVNRLLDRYYLTRGKVMQYLLKGFLNKPKASGNKQIEILKNSCFLDIPKRE